MGLVVITISLGIILFVVLVVSVKRDMGIREQMEFKDACQRLLQAELKRVEEACTKYAREQREAIAERDRYRTAAIRYRAERNEWRQWYAEVVGSITGRMKDGEKEAK